MKVNDLRHDGLPAWAPIRDTLEPLDTLLGVVIPAQRTHLVLLINRERRVFRWEFPPGLERMATILKQRVGTHLKDFGEIEVGASRLDDAELRAHVTSALDRGALPRSTLAIRDTGTFDGRCSVCGDPDPGVTYHYRDQLVLRLHLYCEVVWQTCWREMR